MSIGTTIKRLRREKDITQEQLAEYLGITSRAVSQWECDRTAPDISMIAPLTSIFEVTADQLLAIDVSSKEKQIEKLYVEAYNVASTGNQALAIEMCEAALAKHPSSYKLMDFYANEIYLYNHMTPVEKQESNQKRAFAYLERILAECTDPEIRNNSLTMACLWYAKLGRVEEAERLAMTLEGSMWTCGELLGKIYTGRRQFEVLRDEMLRQFTNAIGYLLEDLKDTKDDGGNPIYTQNERLGLNKMCVDLLSLYFPDGDYLYHAQYAARAYRQMAEIYASGQDREKTLECVAAAADFTVQFDAVKAGDTHTSPAVKGMEAEEAWWNDGHNSSKALLDRVRTDAVFDFVREDQRFQKILEKLAKTAK